MRKQYHFRESERGLLSWDVDRLVGLARNLPPQRIPISEIRELDEAYWFGSDAQRPTCRAIAEHAKLINNADLAYPIILDAGGRVFDGMHRVVKALLEGEPTIEAVRFVETPPPDYVGRPRDELPY